MKEAFKEEMNMETLLTSHQVGDLIRANPTSVNKWVEEGLIPAFRTPGGHRRIKALDLLLFLNTHKMPIPKVMEAIARRRLLVVDGDAKTLKALERSLKKHDARVQLVTTTHGIDALVQVGAFKPHMVILDVHMSDLDGLEICRRLKANPATAQIEVYVTSAQLKADMMKKVTDAGAKGWLPKPIDPNVVLQHLGLHSSSAFHLDS